MPRVQCLIPPGLLRWFHDQCGLPEPRHPVSALTHRTCRQALIKKCVVLLRNAWWVTQKTLTLHFCYSDSKRQYKM